MVPRTRGESNGCTLPAILWERYCKAHRVQDVECRRGWIGIANDNDPIVPAIIQSFWVEDNQESSPNLQH
jgi:hypothetical protein